MGNTPELQWRIAEDDDEWAKLTALRHPGALALPDPFLSAAEGAACANYVWLRSGLMLLILAGAVTLSLMHLWRRAEANLETVAEELALTTAAEEWATVHDKRAIAAALLDDQADSAWQRAILIDEFLDASQAEAVSSRTTVEVEGVELRGDKVMARLRLATTMPDGSRKQYHETRFYRDSRKGWVHTAPVLALCGSPQIIATDHLAFRFHACDAPAVLAIAERVDQAYVGMLADWGLPVPTASPPLTIEVALASPRVVKYPVERTEGIRLTVTSPTVQRIPADLADAAVLQQSIANALVEHTLTAAFHHHVPATVHNAELQAEPLYAALRLWQLWRQDGPLASWRTRLVAWHHALGRSPSGGSILPPDDYARLCDLNRLWPILPAWVDLPLTCLPGEAKRDAAGLPARQDLFSTEFRNQVYCQLMFTCYSGKYQGRTIEAMTFLEYLLSEHGEHPLPEIIRGFAAHVTWRELMQALYGPQEAELRAGWCNYLSHEYGFGHCNVRDE
jgi:hypothetical protein